MSCDFSGTLLHAYLDGELDAVRAAEFEHHLETCRDCTATLGATESLRSSLQRTQLYESALRRRYTKRFAPSLSFPPAARRAPPSPLRRLGAGLPLPLRFY